MTSATDHTALKEAAEFRKAVIETGLEIIANQPTGMTLTEWCDFSNAILELLAENEALREALERIAQTRMGTNTGLQVVGIAEDALRARALTEKQS
jgi:hypothetical protein